MLSTSRTGFGNESLKENLIFYEKENHSKGKHSLISSNQISFYSKYLVICQQNVPVALNYLFHNKLKVFNILENPKNIFEVNVFVTSREE